MTLILDATTAAVSDWQETSGLHHLVEAWRPPEAQGRLPAPAAETGMLAFPSTVARRESSRGSGATLSFFF